MLDLLNHLPAPPPDFRTRCRAAESWSDLERLAAFRLDGNQLELLAKARKRIGSTSAPITLGILSNATTDFLPAAISATALRYGLDVDVVVGDYGQIFEDATSPISPINRQRCDVILLAVDYRGLRLAPVQGDDGAAAVKAAIELLGATRTALKEHHAAPVIFQSVPPPAASLFGNMDRVIARSTNAAVHEFNTALSGLVRQSKGDLIVDVESLANSIGLSRWHSPVQWNHAKLPFDLAALPAYADYVVRLIAAQRGRSRKCLVLDLDNTIWGGAIGDLGIEGIELGEGSPLGEAFLEVQRTALRLRDRGVILAVCSKNDYQNAIRPFREHPDMLLKEHHIAAFQANWIDKPTNIEEIAKLLNIGVDSLVLLDDNPAERILVRESLPSVGVPELPEDPSLYPTILLNAGYFESVALTAEDSQRAEQYRANALRTTLEKSARDPFEFLSALEMTITLAPFDHINRARITQLVNKTNQFNLTTRRYSENEIAAMEADPSYWTLQARLVDKFGDNGMICCVIAKDAPDDVLEIDTWLMSCRVLARRVEECCMAKLFEHARLRGKSTVVGRYRATAKNAMVKEFYARFGFHVLEEHPQETVWSLPVADFKPVELPMRQDDRFKPVERAAE